MVKRLVLDQILKLDPKIDHVRIVHLDACYEFPFDFTRADEFALYRTYAVPSIANLLDSTGEFNKRTQRRYDDTKLIISEMVEHGYDSERGQRAMSRMNHHHGRFDISNSDLLYVLSTFAFEPPRWMARYARRPMVEQERLLCSTSGARWGNECTSRRYPMKYRSSRDSTLSMSNRTSVTPKVDIE